MGKDKIGKKFHYEHARLDQSTCLRLAMIAQRKRIELHQYSFSNDPQTVVGFIIFSCRKQASILDIQRIRAIEIVIKPALLCIFYRYLAKLSIDNVDVYQ